jgi:hypothetical protein
MYRRKHAVGRAALLATLCVLPYVAGPTPIWAEPAIASDVLSGGGGKSTSDSYVITDTFGQDPIGPVATGAGTQLYDGFWNTVTRGATVPQDTVPPSNVAGLTATSRDAAVDLEWTNPSDADFVKTVIRYALNGYPADPDSGNEVGTFYGSPGSGGAFTHTQLLNDTRYYYTAFAFDAVGNHASGDTTSAVPHDAVPPDTIPVVEIAVGDSAVTLIWTNPSDPDFEHTLIRYSLVRFPEHPDSGSAIEGGDEGRFMNAPGSHDQFAHSQLQNDQTYYYALFAGDEVPNYSDAFTIMATPADLVAPASVSDFTAEALSDGSIKLDWTNPSDTDVAGVVIRYSTEAYPESAQGGLPVDGSGSGSFPGEPAAAYSFTHESLTTDTTYFYTAFAHDEVPNYSAGATALAAAQDLVPPDLAIRVLQNPYITNHLDLYVIASEVLDQASIECNVDGYDLDMEIMDPDENVWRGDYDLCTTGVIPISVHAEDVSENPRDTTYEFTSSFVHAVSGGTARSVDGQCDIRMPAGTIRRDAYVLIMAHDFDGLMGGRAYEVSPAGLTIEDYVEIAIACPDSAGQPEHLSICSFEGESIEWVQSYLDREANRIVAYVSKLGTYGIGWRDDVVTPTLGEGKFLVFQNIPNPFVASTRISFVIPRADRVRIDVISIDGRMVGAVFDDLLPPGSHSIEWDGNGHNGQTVVGGVYFYRVAYGSQTVTKKMVYLR